MKASIGLLFAASLFAGSALAQSSSGTTAPPVAAQPTTTPAVKAPGAKTVEGLTVTGKIFPKAECGSRDRDCINMVVAELKRLYPEQLKRFCFQREMRTMRNATLFGDSDPTGQEPPQSVTTFTTTAPLYIACAPDKK